MLQFQNGIEIETVSMGGTIRGKRPTLIVVDDPQENKDVLNKAITDKFNYWFFSSVYNTLDDSGRCIVVGTVVGSLCLVQHLKEHSDFHLIEYQAVIDAQFGRGEDGKMHLFGGTPIWSEKWSIEQLDRRLQKI